MDIQRVEFKDGWAMAHTRPSHGQIKAFYKAFRGKEEAELVSTQDELILILVEEWSVNGSASAKPTRQSIDDAPQDSVTELTGKLSGFLDTEEPEPGEA